mmetsp:Transcript_12006/g.39520  ORF Transcript_12006/g.39520 Transcript_12006/m.39520 type:complete len:237 (+) Transcript_12006:150-860(+)
MRSCPSTAAAAFVSASAPFASPERAKSSSSSRPFFQRSRIARRLPWSAANPLLAAPRACKPLCVQKRRARKAVFMSASPLPIVSGVEKKLAEGSSIPAARATCSRRMPGSSEMRLRFFPPPMATLQASGATLWSTAAKRYPSAKLPPRFSASSSTPSQSPARTPVADVEAPPPSRPSASSETSTSSSSSESSALFPRAGSTSGFRHCQFAHRSKTSSTGSERATRSEYSQSSFVCS